jgi:predicted N-acetyltransferase YhbS
MEQALPHTLAEITDYIWGKWGGESNRPFYEDSIAHSIGHDGLPKFYAAREDGTIIGCIALLANDLVSRQDLWPWLACVYVEQAHRKRGIGGLLLSHATEQARRMGYDRVYLLTDHVGYYERYGFEYLCDAFDAKGEAGRVYTKSTASIA